MLLVQSIRVTRLNDEARADITVLDAESADALIESQSKLSDGDIESRICDLEDLLSIPRTQRWSPEQESFQRARDVLVQEMIAT